MPRHTLLAPALALLLASPFVLAQETPPRAPQAQPSGTDQASMGPAMKPQRMIGHRMMGDRMERMRMEHGPGMGAFADLHALERLYREAGQDKELAGLYNEVLARSQDTHLRAYVYHQLARQQARPANVDQAIATLRKSLSENLANEAKMQAERERMHASRQAGAAR